MKPSEQLQKVLITGGADFAQQSKISKYSKSITPSGMHNEYA